MSPGVLITQVAQGVGVLAGAWVVKSIMDAENAKPMVGGADRCPTCVGSRTVPCFCNRWSDNDVGCGTCGGTGKMPCTSCGGSGKGRPIPVQLHVPSSSKRSE